MSRLLSLLKRVMSVIQREGVRSLLRTMRTFVLRRPAYWRWWHQNHPRSAELKIMKKTLDLWPLENLPLISVIMPVYNPDIPFLKKAIESVLTQVYPHFQLCICDDASTNRQIRPILESYAKKDSRIQVIYHEKNQHISGASNSALTLATGDYISLLDHDDELAPSALYEVAKFIIESKETPDLIYTDEDKIGRCNLHHTPFFKPDWSPELLESIMYIGHLGIYRRALVEKVGGFRLGYEGSQDHDLALRVSEQAKQIHHIPKVLYHWREHAGSTAGGLSAKSYVVQSAQKALLDHLKRFDEKGTIETGLWLGSYRTQRVIKNTPLISIIIPFKDRVDLLKTCLSSLQSKTIYSHYELVLVDNQSVEQTTHDFLSELPQSDSLQILSYPHAFNFSKINNFAAQKACGEILLFLNNDTEVIEPTWLESMLEHVQRPEIAAVGAKLLYPNHTVQHAGVVMGIAGTCSHAFRHVSESLHGYLGLKDVVRNVSAVTAACLMMRREVFEKLKGFNEDYEIAYQDVDLCLRALQLGYRNVYTPYAVLTHYESLTRKHAFAPHETALLKKEWRHIIDHDPYYHPNLTRIHEDYRLG